MLAKMKSGEIGKKKSGDITSLESGSASWMEDTDKCTICNDKLGKRALNPRHHCRLCGRCVCNKCSPSTQEVEGCEGAQRVCKLCVTEAFEEAKVGAKAKERLEEVVVRIRKVSGLSDPTRPQAPDVDEAVTECASAVDVVERRMSDVQSELLAYVSRTEATEVSLAACESRAEATEASLAEARLKGQVEARELAACESRAEATEARFKGELSEAQALQAVERKARDELQEALATCEAALSESRASCMAEEQKTSQWQIALASSEAELRASEERIVQEMIVRGELQDSLSSGATLKQQLTEGKGTNAELREALKAAEARYAAQVAEVSQAQGRANFAEGRAAAAEAAAARHKAAAWKAGGGAPDTLTSTTAPSTTATDPLLSGAHNGSPSSRPTNASDDAAMRRAIGESGASRAGKCGCEVQ